ncbi:LacI family DNA-binding transcriptional regulator [uncultured Sphaerochaeta sp.]|uniref:LacI family DNA-binding transcriptional regulator n=1 Tax=uncultured Sphaerochaeta sp. TaxID=886478 RepID=UPI002A0A1AF0|nr:LacI family DNA-binding transcriptional regulator [uncultured Sphaerochaeta sp.]
MSSKRNVTSREIAHLAGVSQATVSRSFNYPDKVSPETRKKIFGLANRLEYSPNVIAKSLVSSKTNIIGAVIEDFENPFYVSFVHRLAEKLATYGKKILLFNPRGDEGIQKLLQEARGFRIDGLIVASATLSQQLTEREIPTSIPVVMINRQSASSHYCSVASDDVSCGRAVADYLVGIKRFAQYVYVSGSIAKSSSIDRKKGYVERLKEWGISSPVVISGDFSYLSGFEAANQLLKKELTLPLAVFVANDLMAMGFLDGIRKAGNFIIPQDIAIIGADNIEQSSWVSYNLTTMQLPTAEMIDYAFQYLNSDESRREEMSGRHLFPCSLIVRGTV